MIDFPVIPGKVNINDVKIKLIFSRRDIYSCRLVFSMNNFDSVAKYSSFG